VPPATVLGIAGGVLVMPWRRVGAAPGTAYGVAVLLAATATGRRPAPTLRLLAVFPTMHMSWAAGFLGRSFHWGHR
ncbi:MAG: hypothetical protein AAFZ07_11490, partial [Actinomycetota bacterium]